MDVLPLFTLAFASSARLIIQACIHGKALRKGTQPGHVFLATTLCSTRHTSAPVHCVQTSALVHQHLVQTHTHSQFYFSKSHEGGWRKHLWWRTGGHIACFALRGIHCGISIAEGRLHLPWQARRTGHAFPGIHKGCAITPSKRVHAKWTLAVARHAISV